MHHFIGEYTQNLVAAARGPAQSVPDEAKPYNSDDAWVSALMDGIKESSSCETLLPRIMPDINPIL